MDTHTALSAIRALDALPEGRRRYLCTAAATARTDADSARIVLEARHEERSVRTNFERDLRAEYDSRRAWASRNPEKPVETPQKPSQRMVRTDDTTPEHRPVTVRFVEPTKTDKAPRTRPEGIGKNHVYDGPVPAQAEKYSARTHGIVSTYNAGCRCDACSEASKRHGREYRARKKQAVSGKSD